MKLKYYNSNSIKKNNAYSFNDSIDFDLKKKTSKKF